MEGLKLPEPLNRQIATRSELEIVDVVSASVLKVGEWSKPRVILRGRGVFTLKLEGDVDYISEDIYNINYNINAEAGVEIAMKPRITGEVLVKG
jgi:hypothetical protein